MDYFLLFFESLTTLQKGIWLSAVLTLCWALEFVFPLFRHSYRKWRHAGVNFAFLGFSSAINLAINPLIVLIALWTTRQEIGFLHVLQLPIWAELLIAVALFDLVAQYVAHYCLHKVPLLFRFHRVHHSDTSVDATTGTRHHPVDYLVREVLSIGVLLVSGAPAAYYIFTGW